VHIRRGGELAEIRDAITRTVEPVAEWRGQLAAD